MWLLVGVLINLLASYVKISLSGKTYKSTSDTLTPINHLDPFSNQVQVSSVVRFKSCVLPPPPTVFFSNGSRNIPIISIKSFRCLWGMDWLLVCNLDKTCVSVIAMTWFGKLISDPWPPRPEFNGGVIHTRYVVDRMALGQGFFSRAAWFFSRCHSTSALYLFSSSDFSYQEENRARSGNTSPEIRSTVKAPPPPLSILPGFCLRAIWFPAIEVDWRNSSAGDQSLWTFQSNAASSFRLNALWLPAETSR